MVPVLAHVPIFKAFNCTTNSGQFNLAEILNFSPVLKVKLAFWIRTRVLNPGPGIRLNSYPRTA
jgi:hypothetical protein